MRALVAVAVPARHLNSLPCLLYFVAWTAALGGLVVCLYRRHGSPRYWGLVARVATLVVCLLGFAAWIWINRRVELGIVVVFRAEHGLTVGDLLGLPALVLAALVVRG